MTFRVLAGILVLIPWLLRAETEISAPTSESDRQDSTSEQEWEAKDIIPDGGLIVSTQPITPITQVPEKKPHDQALEELALADTLWKSGKAQAASDVALEAYDDLMSLHLGRRSKKQRQKLRQERRQAATVYIDSSLAYVTDYIRRNGDGPHAVAEGVARLGDLRDVAQNYSELNKKLDAAFALYEVKPSTPVVQAPTPAAAASPAATAAPATSTTTIKS